METLLFKFNGNTVYKLDYRFCENPRSIISKLFPILPNVEYWSEDGLRNFIDGTLESIIEFCEEIAIQVSIDLKTKPKSWHKREEAKSLNLQTKSLIRFLTRYRSILPNLDKDQLLSQIYNLSLASENLGHLRGFGVASVDKKSVKRILTNPEKTSIRRKDG